jgi:hypothetical protein
MGDGDDVDIHQLIPYPGEDGATVYMEVGEALGIAQVISWEVEHMTGRYRPRLRGAYLPDGRYRILEWRWSSEPDTEYRPLPFSNRREPDTD